MPGNRVEELEQTVTRLESTVSGLTEELVEAKGRIRDLEAELEPQPADGTAVPEVDPEAADPASAGDAAEQLDGDGDAVEDERTEFGDDIIVA
ncbi:hypothetical protein BRD10_00335 [Halobacteriales archaeon SW_12_71_31]|nr:MAG: hypothetical protein BRD10_00335 [Halobacteriales archaeon SW_12_71_31]